MKIKNTEIKSKLHCRATAAMEAEIQKDLAKKDKAISSILPEEDEDEDETQDGESDGG